MNIFSKNLVLLLVLLATGCGTYTEKAPSTEKALPADKAPSLSGPAAQAARQDAALVYVYRVGKGPELTRGSVDITVDGKDVVSLDNKGFTSFNLKPGSHTFVAKWPFMSKPLFDGDHFDPKTITLSFEAGKKYYINYLVHKGTKPSTTAGATGSTEEAFSKPYTVSVGLLLEGEGVALSKLSMCTHQKNNID